MDEDIVEQGEDGQMAGVVNEAEKLNMLDEQLGHKSMDVETMKDKETDAKKFAGVALCTHGDGGRGGHMPIASMCTNGQLLKLYLSSSQTGRLEIISVRNLRL